MRADGMAIGRRYDQPVILAAQFSGVGKQLRIQRIAGRLS